MRDGLTTSNNGAHIMFNPDYYFLTSSGSKANLLKNRSVPQFNKIQSFKGVKRSGNCLTDSAPGGYWSVFCSNLLNFAHQRNLPTLNVATTGLVSQTLE